MGQGAFGTSQTVRNFKLLVILGCVGSVIFLGLEAFREHLGGEWRAWQVSYGEKLAPEFRNAHEIGIKQVFLRELGRVDRCQTCHAGIDDPSMASEALPLRTHSGGFLDAHPIDRFGCTICHHGQGRATNLDAHGYVPNWDEPLLRAAMIYSSCFQCHPENGLFGDEAEHFAGRVADLEIYVGDLRRGIPGADSLQRGKQLTAESGCLGCHVYRGRGGTLGPDLTHAGDKTSHEYDYSHLPEGVEHTPLGWQQAHFRAPQAVSPGTTMPALDSSDEDNEALAAYILSLQLSTVPAQYRAVPSTDKGAPLPGKGLYGLFCVACHGEDLESGGIATIVTPVLSNEDFLSVATDEFLKATIALGRRGTTMQPWSASGGGLTARQIGRIAEYIRSFAPESADLAVVMRLEGDPDSGSYLFEENCAACHGYDGEGGLGTRLNSPDFLVIISDEMLARTIIDGRPETGMPSGLGLDAQDVADLLAFIRSWEHPGVTIESVTAFLGETGGDQHVGKGLYDHRCAGCHGARGEGGIGPSVNLDAFLSIASDEFLALSIRDGRPGTAMPGFGYLSAEDLGNLIAYMRSFGGAERVELVPIDADGDVEYGALLYGRLCAECHGAEAVGGVGPQLRNSAFLTHASDAFLRATVGARRHAHLAGVEALAELSEAQTLDIVSYLRSLYRAPSETPPRVVFGDTDRGRAIYEGRARCAECHGIHGEGREGPALGHRAFFEQTNAGFLIGAMVNGIEGTTMPSFGPDAEVALSPQELMDVAAYVRTLPERLPSGRAGWRSFVRTEEQVKHGAELFKSRCSSCHARTDEGQLKATELQNPDFLAVASDGFLLASTARGRRGTTMLPFGPGPDTVIELSPDEILDIVAYLRSCENRRPVVEGEVARPEQSSE